MNIWKLHRFNADAFQSKPVRFFDALLQSLRALSTEKRGKVFALLELVFDSVLCLPVLNYRQCLMEIFIGMAISGINHSVSDAYVQGIMDGKVTKKCQDVRWTQIEIY